MEWKRFNRLPGLRKVLAEKGFVEKIFRDRKNEPIERWHPLVFRRITTDPGEAETRHFIMIHSPKDRMRTIVPFVLIGGLSESLGILQEAFPGRPLTRASGGFIRVGLRQFRIEAALLDLEPKRRMLPAINDMETVAKAFAGLANGEMLRAAAEAIEASMTIESSCNLEVDDNAFKRELLERRKEFHAIVIDAKRLLKGNDMLVKAVRLLETYD